MPMGAADAISAAHTMGHPTMNDAARRLRAQKAYSTDPTYLERMARREEARVAEPANDATAEDVSALERRRRDTARTARRA
jgi:hypothetical protein